MDTLFGTFSEQKALAFNRFLEMRHAEDWEFIEFCCVNLDMKKPNDISMKTYARKTQPHCFCLKLEYLFPGIEASLLSSLTSNPESRMKVDQNYIEAEILEKDLETNSTLLYTKLPPPKGPANQAELVIRWFDHGLYEQDKYLSFSSSVEHPLKPIQNSLFALKRANRLCNAEVIQANPDGPGTLLTQYFHVNLNINTFKFVMDAILLDTV